jgi:hypothetical protein
VSSKHRLTKKIIYCWFNCGLKAISSPAQRWSFNEAGQMTLFRADMTRETSYLLRKKKGVVGKEKWARVL